MRNVLIDILWYLYEFDMAVENIVVQEIGGVWTITQWGAAGPQPDEQTLVDTYATSPVFISWRAMFYRNNGPNGYRDDREYIRMIYKDLKDGTNYFTTEIGTIEYVDYPLDGIPKSLPPVSEIVTASRNVQSSAVSEIVIAKNNSTQAISGTSKVDLVLSTEVADVNSHFSSNTFTCGSTGYYELSAFAKVENLAILTLIANYEWQLYVTVNGSTSTLIDTYTHGILAALPAALRGSIMLPLTSGDTVKIQLQKTNSTSLNASNAYFNIKKVCNQ